MSRKPCVTIRNGNAHVSSAPCVAAVAPAPSAQAAHHIISHRGILHRVRGYGKTTYLFGTAHAQTAFVGIGLLHLIAGNGLPPLLIRRGYEVEQIY